MKLIATNSALRKNLSRLLRSYPHASIAVAWASAKTPVLDHLLAHPKIIQKAVIGTHFYQTHPDVLDAFVKSTRVRFTLQPRGVFHPKLYLFWNSKRWEVLIGSANLTNAALTDNSEALLLVSDADDGASHLKGDIITLIDGYWNNARAITTRDAKAYRQLWQRYQPTLRKLAGTFGKKPSSKAPAESSVMSMPWEQYLAKVNGDETHGVGKRSDLLSAIQSAFRSHARFADMNDDQRKVIAGLPNSLDDRWGWFGSMKGAGVYGHAVRENDAHLSAALDEIPMDGPVSRSQYDAYLAEFKKAFPKGRYGIAVTSRLLAMKRPDQFVCLDSKNQRALCKDFGVKHTSLDVDSYWDEIVERIVESPWWNSTAPPNAKERSVWAYRAAMLDAIFYTP